MPDELIDRLSAIRPDAPTGLLEPDPNLLEEILMTNQPKKRRAVTPLRLSAAAAAAAAALVAVNIAGPGQQAAAPPTRAEVVAPNMVTIAQSTAAALTSGVAHMKYASDDGHFIHDSGELTIEFSGDNRSSVGTQTSDRSSFTFANKVVDGRFYLLDGAPGQQRWIEDTNEHITGSDLFSVDPRRLVSESAQQAGFVDAGASDVEGVPTRHLKATRLDKVPAVNLGLGPITDDKTKVTKFEVWVDADDVVRRLDIATSLTETVYPLARTVVTTDANGNLHKTLDTTGSPSEERTQVNTYAITFTDIGADIVIEAPANARQVAGQG